MPFRDLTRRVRSASQQISTAAKAASRQQPRAVRPAVRSRPPVPSGNFVSSPGPVQTLTPPRPKPPSLKEFLAGDEVYQQALRGSSRTLADFLSELQRQRGEAGTAFRTTRENMETQRERQLQQLRDEFAARGLLQSGVYAGRQTMFEQDFARQLDDLQRSYNSLLQDLLAQETNFRRKQELALEMARQEAIARRAARYDLR